MGVKGKTRSDKSKGGKSPRSFALSRVGQMGVKKLCIDWQVEVVPAFPGGT